MSTRYQDRPSDARHGWVILITKGPAKGWLAHAGRVFESSIEADGCLPDEGEEDEYTWTRAEVDVVPATQAEAMYWAAEQEQKEYLVDDRARWRA